MSGVMFHLTFRGYSVFENILSIKQFKFENVNIQG